MTRPRWFRIIWDDMGAIPSGHRLISSSWHMAPEAVNAAMRSGIAAAVWRQDTALSEVQASPDPLASRVSIALQPLHGQIWYDGRLQAKGTLDAGGCLVVPSGVQTRGVIREGWRILHVYVPNAFLQRTSAEAGIHRPVEIIARRAAADPILSRLAHAIARGLMKADPFAQLALDAAGLQVAVELLKRYSNAGEPPSVPALTGWQLRRAIEFLQDHLAAPIQLADAAAAVGLSPYHFCRAFGASVGVPPQQYLRAIRMRKAEELLAQGIPVSSAAARLGYRNVAAFARAFKRETGHSPRLARNGRPN